MFQVRKRETTFRKVLTFCDLVYHNIVRTIRKTHGNALMSIVMNLMQMIIFVLAFYFMFSILGLRGAVLRGDFMVYIMTGIFLFMTHIKTVGAVAGSEGPASPMMKHAPMNTSISIAATALTQLYIQMLSLFVIMFAYHVLVTPFEIQNVTGVMFMILLAWFTAVAVGLVFLAIKPWAPGLSSLLSDDLPACQHDRIGQNVRCQHTEPTTACHVRLESSVSLHRSVARLRLRQLRAAQFFMGVRILCGPHIPHDWHDGRILHPQTRLRELERASVKRASSF